MFYSCFTFPYEEFILYTYTLDIHEKMCGKGVASIWISGVTMTSRVHVTYLDNNPRVSQSKHFKLSISLLCDNTCYSSQGAAWNRVYVSGAGRRWCMGAELCQTYRGGGVVIIY